MATGVNLYELMHGFWKENDYEPFPASATALFFLLLERANSRHWNMPIRCPTTYISRALMVSEQTVINSRKALCNRGIIRFNKGLGNTSSPSYTIVTDPKNWTVRLGDNLADSLEDGLGDDSEDGLNTYNKKDRKIKDQRSSLYKAEEKKILSLDELERIFLSDTKWHESIISHLSKSYSLTVEDLKEHISRFFNQLRCQRIDQREEKDCRTHFFNWINKILKENTNATNKQPDTDRRRGSDVTATSARDYNGAF